MQSEDHSRPATKADINKLEKRVNNSIEVAVAQISQAVIKALEKHPTKDEVPSKEDHRRLENKVNELDHKVDNLSSDTSDIRRRVIDLEHDTPTQKEVDDLKKFVGYPPKS